MRAPLVYALVELKQRNSQESEAFVVMFKRKCEQEGDVAFVIDLLMKRSAGIEVADCLSI